VTENLYDQGYVQEHGFGFDYFKAEIATCTPEWRIRKRASCPS